MTPNLSYTEFVQGLKGTDGAIQQSGFALEGAKRLAFCLFWIRFQFAWRMNSWDRRLDPRWRVFVHLVLFFFLILLVFLPLLITPSRISTEGFSSTITLPCLPADPGIAPDTLLNHVTLNQLCNDQ